MKSGEKSKHSVQCFVSWHSCLFYALFLDHLLCFKLIGTYAEKQYPLEHPIKALLKLKFDYLFDY